MTAFAECGCFYVLPCSGIKLFDMEPTMRLIIPVLLLLLSTACATTERTLPTPEELALTKGYAIVDEVDRINKYRVDGWSYVSDRAIIINGGPRNKYLLMLQTDCTDLRSREIIGYTTTLNNVLSRFDAIVVRERPRTINHKCYIDKMYKIIKLKEDDN